MFGPVFLVVLLFFTSSRCNAFCSEEMNKLFHGFPGKVLSIPLPKENVTQLSMVVDDDMNCAFACAAQRWCRSVNFKVVVELDGKHSCELLSADDFTHRKHIKHNDNFTFLSVKNPCEREAYQCKNGGTCKPCGRSDQFYCSCIKGFTGKTCDEDIDECISGGHDCDVNAECTNTYGSYKCRCNYGYEGNGVTCDAVKSTRCLDLVNNGLAPENGYYQLKGNSGPYKSYCDVANGGWTLIGRFSNKDTKNWMADSGSWWYDTTSPHGDTGNPAIDKDMISPAFWQVNGNHIKITRSDDANHTALLYTPASCYGFKPFRSKMTGFGNFRNGVVWASDKCLGSCSVVYGGLYKSTLGFAQAQCDGSIQTRNKIGFWCASGTGDGAIMTIGGGGSECARADHGIAITEADKPSLNDNGEKEYDFGNDANSIPSTPYALNLWVK